MFPYEQLEVYKKAYRVNKKIYEVIKGKNISAEYAKTQLGRSGLSVMLNIAEGSGKFTAKDRKNFFATARGSAFECCALVCFLHEEGEIAAEARDVLYSTLDEISRILFAMIKNLDSKINLQ